MSKSIILSFAALCVIIGCTSCHVRRADESVYQLIGEFKSKEKAILEDRDSRAYYIVRVKKIEDMRSLDYQSRQNLNYLKNALLDKITYDESVKRYQQEEKEKQPDNCGTADADQNASKNNSSEVKKEVKTKTSSGANEAKKSNSSAAKGSSGKSSSSDTKKPRRKLAL